MPNMGVDDGKKEERGEGVTAVYKLHLHCQQCAEDIKKPLSRTEGVEKVDADADEDKVSIKGKIDPQRIQKLLERKAKRKVELVEAKKEEKRGGKKKDEEDEEEIKSTVLKVDMHCHRCANDLKRALMEIKGVIKVKTNWEKQICTVEGIAKPEELIKCARKKLNKHAKIVPPKGKKEERKEKEDEMEEKEVESSSSKILVPCVISYPHMPHDTLSTFSDENPNACLVM